MHFKKNAAISTLLFCLIGAAASAAQAQEDILVIETARPTLYLNGGIGTTEQAYMKKTAKDFNLRMVFSEHKDGEFVADARVSIVDARGNTVFFLPSAGPMTNLILPDGKYRVSATFKGMTESQTVSIAGNQAKDLYFHWNKPAK